MTSIRPPCGTGQKTGFERPKNRAPAKTWRSPHPQMTFLSLRCPVRCLPSMTITVPLPASLEQKMQPQSAKLHLAVGVFSAAEVTLGQGAEIAGLSQTDFMQELARRRIPLHYGQEEFAEDLQTIAELNEKLDHGHRQWHVTADCIAFHSQGMTSATNIWSCRHTACRSRRTPPCPCVVAQVDRSHCSSHDSQIGCRSRSWSRRD